MKLTKIPSLKVVADELAAQKLRELVKDADDGLRRVVRCGLYIEWIAANLPHGQFRLWLETNVPDVAIVTVHRWRSMAKNICEWVGFKYSQWEHLPVANCLLLDCPVEDLPEKVRAARTKMDELLDSARTPRQLFFDMGFRQGELDAHGYPRAKRGRNKGQGGATKAQRAAAKELSLIARLEGLIHSAPPTVEWLLTNCHENGFARMDEVPGGAEVLAQLTEAVGHVHYFLQALKKGRGQ